METSFNETNSTKKPFDLSQLFNLLKDAKFKDIYYQKITNGSKRNLQRDLKVDKFISSTIEDFYKKYLLKQETEIKVSELSVKSALERGQRR